MIAAADVTGVILAGGKSSRMGEDKALITLNGKTLIEHVASAMKLVFERVILVARADPSYSFLELQSFDDIYSDCGPLGGIHSGFIRSGAAAIFVTACDTPFITRDLIRYIALFPAHTPAKIPSLDGCHHPLCGVYDRGCLTQIIDHVQDRRLKVMDLLTEIRTTFIPVGPSLPWYTPNLLANVNDKAELNGLKELTR
jgi:molybdopterin-guanine dinucleotide biosynthesis protein A